MKRNKVYTTIGLLAILLFAIGLLMAFFCTETWQRILGLVVALINVIFVIDFMSDSL